MTIPQIGSHLDPPVCGVPGSAVVERRQALERTADGTIHVVARCADYLGAAGPGRVAPAAARTRMGKLPIEQLVPGQRVARPVLTASHAVLMQPGFLLTETFIDRLRHHGVQEVWVDEAPDADDPPLPDEQLAALEDRFAHHESNPLMLELRDVIARQLTQEHQAHAGDI